MSKQLRSDLEESYLYAYDRKVCPWKHTYEDGGYFELTKELIQLVFTPDEYKELEDKVAALYDKPDLCTGCEKELDTKNQPARYCTACDKKVAAMRSEN